MIEKPVFSSTLPKVSDAAGIVSWAHIGDLHMTEAGAQNHLDLLRIIRQLNEAFVANLAFVYLPGDTADQGSAAQYEVVREALDTLHIPWFPIVGDHDVHEKSFINFLTYMSAQTHSSFSIGNLQFFALNAFDVPEPQSFTVQHSQLEWLEAGLQAMSPEQSAVLLLHCYPSDLKQGGEALRELITRFPVQLVEMGHTHYNEVANDGRTLYAATRSTGQVEEGPVGFSVTCIDGPVVSWRFFELGELPALMITSPVDERFITERNAAMLVVKDAVRLRAKVWSSVPVQAVRATLGGVTVQLTPIQDTAVWEGELSRSSLSDGVYDLTMEAVDEAGKHATDQIRVIIGESAYSAPERKRRDQDNALARWPEHGLLGTQLGPNKHGRKW